MARNVQGKEGEAVAASSAARSLLRSRLAGLSEAECGEVIEYIEVMQSLRRQADDRGLFGHGFARRVSAMCKGRQPTLQNAAS